MSKKIEAMNRVIEFAKANGFPGAYACYWDDHGEALESETSIADDMFPGCRYEKVRLVIALDGLDPKDDTGIVFVGVRDGAGDEDDIVTEVLDEKPEDE